MGYFTILVYFLSSFTLANVNKSSRLNWWSNKITIEEKLRDYADALTPYGVEIRYPRELFIEERDEKEAIQFAEEIVSWAEKIILNNLED